MLLAALGGGCTSLDKPAAAPGYGTVTRAREAPGLQGPYGQPVAVTAQPKPAAVVPAKAEIKADTPAGGDVQQAGFFKKGGAEGCAATISACAARPAAA